MRIVGVLMLFIVASLLDFRYLKKAKKQKKKQMIIYFAIMGLALLLSTLHVMRVNVWSLNRIITDIVQFFLPF